MTDTLIDDRTLYEILNIDINSSNDEIKNAYKKLILKYHPDKNKNISSDEFIKIKNAYDILSNEDTRIKYNNTLNTNTNTISNIDAIIKIMFSKSITINKILSSTNILNLLLDIEINIEYKLCDIWHNIPQQIYYKKNDNNILDKLIYPIELKQIFINEGETIIYNNKIYTGNLIININIIEKKYNGEEYYIYDNELYILINENRIINDRFKIQFLDNNYYKFNLNKMKKTNTKIGTSYYKKNFGLPNINFIDDDTIFIMPGNLFFIIVI